MAVVTGRAAGPRWRAVGAVPGPELRGLVRAYLGSEEWGDVPVQRAELPAAHVVLAVSLSGTLQVARAGAAETAPTALVAGVGRSSVTSCHAGNHAAVEIQLSALAADLVLGVPAGELADRVVDLTDLWGRTGELLAEQLTEPGAAGGAGGGWQSRFSLVEGVLLDRARRAGTTTAPDPRLLLAHRMIHQRGGDLSMGSLLEATGWSRRRLATEFRRHVGLTPKALARLVRFRRAESMLRASRHRSLASVALTCGYYDQAHLNREFRELAGCPPTAYLARLRADVAAAEMGACAPGAVTDVQDGAAGPS